MNNVELYVYVYMDKQCNTWYVGSLDIWGCTLVNHICVVNYIYVLASICVVNYISYMCGELYKCVIKYIYIYICAVK